MPAGRYAQVAVNIPRVSGLFDYHLPDSLCESVYPGSLVVVPFGKQTVQGIVTALAPTSLVQQTRAVEAVLDPLPVLTGYQLQLAAFLADSTLAPLAACLELMLPPGLSQQADTLYNLAGSTPADLTPLQQKITALLHKRGGLRGRQLEAAFPRVNWKDAAQALVRRGVLTAQPVLPPPSVRPKIVRTVQLACPPAAIEAAIEQLGRKNTAAFTRRRAILEFLRSEPWPVDVTWAYAAAGGGTAADLEKLAELGLVHLSESEVWRDPLESIEAGLSTPPQLTGEQAAAWNTLLPAIQRAAQGEPPARFLLHGVTGSGKTEIYLRAVEETLRLGRQALILVPEIALTPQTVRRFIERFPGQVGLVHSRLSPGERYDTWRRARAGSLPVIVGPRSALFTPLPDPGLVILDECHDPSYYQDEILPYYYAVPAALELGRTNRAVVMLGSATPSVSQVFEADTQGWQTLRLTRRIAAHRQAVEPAQPTYQELPPVRVVDMREELKSGNRSIFSRDLQTSLQEVLAAGRQAILFLNRRGSATFVFCRACGASLKCPRCDLPLTLHLHEGQAEILICHTCSYQRRMPPKCPACASPQIAKYGTGTQKVEQEAAALFPQARILRWDAETARTKGSHELILAHFAHHQADILVGTQMVAKGLDLPLVTLVGVILAEVSLNLDDYRAGERTFQLLTQVAGRAGRSPLGGQVILQTFQPEHYAVSAAAGHDFAGFSARELAYRKELGYPPYSRLLRLEFRHADSEQAARQAQTAFDRLKHWIELDQLNATRLIGPVPCFFGRQNGLYRWQVIVRGPDPAGWLRAHLDDLPPAAVLQVDPPSLL